MADGSWEDTFALGAFAAVALVVGAAVLGQHLAAEQADTRKIKANGSVVYSDGELAATPRRTGAARTQKSVVITTNLFSRPHRHSYGPRGAGVSRRAAYACGLSACTRPSRARMKSAEKIRDFAFPR